MKSKQPALVMEASQESIQSWANRPYISDKLREQLLKANVLIVPTEGYSDRDELVYFPSGTEELLHFLRESEQGNLFVDICIEDEDYKELSLHTDLLIIAGFVVTSIVVPVIADLIAEYIKQRVSKRETETVVKSTLTVYDERTGRSVCFSYEGPASEYRDVMVNAMLKLDHSQRPPLLKSVDSKRAYISKRKKRKK